MLVYRLFENCKDLKENEENTIQNKVEFEFPHYKICRFLWNELWVCTVLSITNILGWIWFKMLTQACQRIQSNKFEEKKYSHNGKCPIWSEKA